MYTQTVQIGNEQYEVDFSFKSFNDYDGKHYIVDITQCARITDDDAEVIQVSDELYKKIVGVLDYDDV